MTSAYRLGEELFAARELTAELLAEHAAIDANERIALRFAEAHVEARSRNNPTETKKEYSFADLQKNVPRWLMQVSSDVTEDAEERCKNLEKEIQRSHASRTQRDQRALVWLDRSTSTETLLELRRSASASSVTQLSKSIRSISSKPPSPSVQQSLSQKWLDLIPPPKCVDEESNFNATPQQMLPRVPSRIAGLPDLPIIDDDLTWACGPHDSCHYILPDILLVGSYPGAATEPLHTHKIISLLKAGMDCFVCLQELWELRTRCPPYIHLAQEFSYQLNWSHPSSVPMECWHCPIPDQSVTTMARLEDAVSTMVSRLLAGRRVYVHSWGGNGRVGTLACAFLVKVYGLTAEEAQSYFRITHSSRRARNTWSPGCWPHTPEQFAQVKQMEGLGQELSGELLPRLRA